MDQFPGVAWKRRAHISGWRGNRSPLVESESARECSHWRPVLRRAVRDNLVVCAIRSRLAASSGANRRDRAFHYVARGGCRSALSENAHQDRRSLAAGAHTFHESTGGFLHDFVNGHRPDLRDHFRALRFSEPHHRSTSVYDFGDGGDIECIRADAGRPEILSTDEGRNACLGTTLQLWPWSFVG